MPGIKKAGVLKIIPVNELNWSVIIEQISRWFLLQTYEIIKYQSLTSNYLTNNFGERPKNLVKILSPETVIRSLLIRNYLIFIYILLK